MPLEEIGNETAANDRDAASSRSKKRRTRNEPTPANEMDTNDPEPVVFKPVRKFKRYANKLIREKFAPTMNSLADMAIQGSLSHMKYFFEICGVRERIEQESDRKAEPSLAEVLLEEMRRQREAIAAQSPDIYGIDGMKTSGRYCEADAQG
jgi:hypothetical protein